MCWMQNFRRKCVGFLLRVHRAQFRYWVPRQNDHRCVDAAECTRGRASQASTRCWIDRDLAAKASECTAFRGCIFYLARKSRGRPRSVRDEPRPLQGKCPKDLRPQADGDPADQDPNAGQLWIWGERRGLLEMGN
jgi:hypothetical protein